MRPVYFNQYAMRKMRFGLAIFGISLLLFLSVFGFYKHLDNSSMQSYNSMVKSKFEVNNALDGFERLETSLNIWQNNEELRNSPLRGLNIRSLQPMVQYYSTKHLLGDVKVSLTAPELRKDSFKNNFVYIQYSRGAIDFYSRTDVDAYRFMEDFSANISGYLQIVHFDITKLSAEPHSKRNFKTRVRFIWQELLDKDYAKPSN